MRMSLMRQPCKFKIAREEDLSGSQDVSRWALFSEGRLGLQRVCLRAPLSRCVWGRRDGVDNGLVNGYFERRSDFVE